MGKGYECLDGGGSMGKGPVSREDAFRLSGLADREP